jgi:hypothetical protein
MRYGQPDVVITVDRAGFDACTFETFNLMIEQHKTAVRGHTRRDPAASSHRVLCVFEQRKQAPGL